MILFIVESPFKIKTLRKILKNDFIFRATFGHIKDLPGKKLGIDLQTFTPSFYILPTKRKVLSELKRLIPKVNLIYLATDPDREGEAISYHLYEYLSKINSKPNFKRIDLIEITEFGVKNALSYPREINFNLYQSWLTRRVLDRLIGYLISPCLSKVFKKTLSAGRVQSIALRLIVEREIEIENFIPEITYSLEVILKSDSIIFSTELYHKNRLFKTKSLEDLLKFCEEKLKGQKFILKEVKERIEKIPPPLPLKTTSMIELAQKMLGYEPKETMRYAQVLYENGYITYMRTDSVRVSEYAKKRAKEFIKIYFGEKYIGRGRRIKQTKFVQDAHECIRPTDIYREDVPLSSKERNLYHLIRLFFIASQMAPAEYFVRRYTFINKNLGKDYSLKNTCKKLVFDGFLKILSKDKKEDQIFLDLTKGEIYDFLECKTKKHITEPPSRYTPSSLIRKLESLGIGRPSTYATLLDILYRRNYVVRENRFLKPTELGKQVCQFLVEKFPKFMDYKFTAEMEEDLEKVVNQEKTYLEIVKPTYEVLKEYLNRI